jgi:hypothetical protein
LPTKRKEKVKCTGIALQAYLYGPIYMANSFEELDMLGHIGPNA